MNGKLLPVVVGHADEVDTIIIPRSRPGIVSVSDVLLATLRRFCQK